MKQVTCVCGTEFALLPVPSLEGTPCPKCGTIVDVTDAAELAVSAELVAPRKKKGVPLWAWILAGCALTIDPPGPSYSESEYDDALIALYVANANALGRAFADLGPAADRMAGSTDMANVSLAIPSIHPMMAIDSDGESANNFVRTAQNANDPAAGTDRWYILDFVPGSGWSLKLLNGSEVTPTELPSAARVIQDRDALLFVIPKSEIPGPGAGFRVIAFTHTGDFGIGGSQDWSGDHHPLPNLAPLAD